MIPRSQIMRRLPATSYSYQTLVYTPTIHATSLFYLGLLRTSRKFNFIVKKSKILVNWRKNHQILNVVRLHARAFSFKISRGDQGKITM